jgi:hypothetical protein
MKTIMSKSQTEAKQDQSVTDGNAVIKYDAGAIYRDARSNLGRLPPVGPVKPALAAWIGSLPV